MKIHEYNEMMSYLTRPSRQNFKRGGDGTKQYDYKNPQQKNQYITRTDEEIQSIVDDPKYANYTRKDFRNEKILTRNETQRKGVNFKNIGARKSTKDPNEENIKRTEKIKKVQGSNISVKGSGQTGKQFSHVYPLIESAKPGTKTTFTIDAKMNRALEGYNKIGQEIAEQQEELIKNKPDGYKEEIVELNAKAKKNVMNAVKNLGKEYKGQIGYFQVDPDTGEFKPKAGNYKMSFAGIEGENKIFKDMTGKERKDFERKISAIEKAKTIPGVTTADKIKRPESAVTRDMFKDAQRRFNKPMTLGAAGDVELAKQILTEDFKKLKSLYGPQAARLAKTVLAGGLGSGAVEIGLLDASQKAGLSPQEIVLNMATAGVGTEFKDIQERADFVRQKGLGRALESALRKETMKQQARPVAGAPAGIFEAQPLTDDEQRALNLFNVDAQNIIDMRRAYQAGEYEKLNQMTDMNDPMFRETFDEGGPSDPSKRKFIKIMGGLASIPVVGKFFKIAEPLAPAVTKAVTEAESIFFDLVNAVKNKGLSAMEKKGIEKFKYKDVEVIEDPEEITAIFKTDQGAPAQITYRKPSYDVDPETGRTTQIPGEFEEGQEIGRYGYDGDVDIDFENEIIDGIEDVKKIINE